MSFIRANSNPECAYIWHDVNGFIAFCTNQHKGILPISLRAWGNLKRAYRQDPYADFNGKYIKVVHDVALNSEYQETEKNAKYFKVKFSIWNPHENKWVHLYFWDVTYHYFMNNAILN